MSQVQVVRPLLTIAIPTYNRAKHLETLLSSLSNQVSDDTRVEVIVSDNASPDNTAEMVSRFQANGFPLRYLRNETNLGADGNILQCYESATGTYLWVFGDDDVLEPGGLKTVLSHLTQQEYDLVHVSSTGFQGTYTPRTIVEPKRAVTFYSSQDLARNVHIFFTFISGNIVNKDRVSSAPHRPFADLLGTNLVQLGWIYTALENHTRSLLIRAPLVATLTDNTGGYSLFKVFGPNLKRITDEWLTNIAVKSPIVNSTLQKFLPTFLSARRRHKSATFSQEDPHTVLCPVLGDNFRYWFFCFPIMRLPVGLARIWFWLGRAINKVDRMLGSPLMR